MHEINLNFKPYYDELDPKRRLEILNKISENEIFSLDFLHHLYTERYSDHDNKGRKNVDWWLWRCICLQQLYSKGKFFKKFRDSEVEKILNELQMNDKEKNHEIFLYHEYRNLARRYLSTCRHSNYASRFMGFQRASDEEKIMQACADVWQMSKGIARSAGVEEKMLLWNEAFRDELMNFNPLCREEYSRLNK